MASLALDAKAFLPGGGTGGSGKDDPELRPGNPARMAWPWEEIRCSDFITGSAFLSMKKGRSAALAMEEKGLGPEIDEMSGSHLRPSGICHFFSGNNIFFPQDFPCGLGIFGLESGGRKREPNPPDPLPFSTRV